MQDFQKKIFFLWWKSNYMVCIDNLFVEYDFMDRSSVRQYIMPKSGRSSLRSLAVGKILAFLRSSQVAQVSHHVVALSKHVPLRRALRGGSEIAMRGAFWESKNTKNTHQISRNPGDLLEICRLFLFKPSKGLPKTPTQLPRGKDEADAPPPESLLDSVAAQAWQLGKGKGEGRGDSKAFCFGLFFWFCFCFGFCYVFWLCSCLD